MSILTRITSLPIGTLIGAAVFALASVALSYFEAASNVAMCTSPFEILNLKIFSTLVLSRLTSFGILQIIFDLTLILAFLDGSPTLAYGNKKRNIAVFIASYIVSVGIWILLGVIFSYYAGYKSVQLYIGTLYNECARGLTPIFWLLFPLYLSNKRNELNQQLKVLTLLLIPTTVYYELFWMSLICFLIGLATLPLVLKTANEPLIPWLGRPKEGKDAGPKLDMPSARKRHFPRVWFCLLTVFLLFSLRWISRTIQRSSDICHANPVAMMGEELQKEGGFLDIVIPTVPRPQNATFLVETMGTFVQTIPLLGGDAFHGKVRLHIINQQTQQYHQVFEGAKMLFGNMAASVYFHDFPEKFYSGPEAVAPPGFPRKVRHHIHGEWASAIWTALQHNGSYVMIADDDNEICPHGWNHMLSSVCFAQRHNKGQCGFFFGSGSNFMMPRAFAEKIMHLLIDEVTEGLGKRILMATDELIISCIEGYHPKCQECRPEGSLVVPSRLLFRHIGWWSARVKQDQRHLLGRSDCTWRHPSNAMLHNTFVVTFDE